MRLLPTAALLCLCALPLHAQDETSLRNWPNWRGPLANGVAPHADPPIQWSETKNVKWKIDVPGRGSATPIVWEDRIFILSAVPTDRRGPQAARDQTQEVAFQQRRRGGVPRRDAPDNIHQFVVLCYDRNTGEEVWRQVAREDVPHEGLHVTNTFASGSPTTDGEFLYVSFGSFGIYCYDLEGTKQWEQDLGTMQTRNGFGEGTSPVLHGDTLVITWDHEADSFIAALDAKTGEVRWRVPRDEPTTWATPFITEYDGRTQVITNGTNRARSYDLRTGELIWECGGQKTNPIPSPLRLDDLVFCMTGYQGYAVYALPLSARGDITDSDVIAWRRSDAGPYISSPILYEGQLYFSKAVKEIVVSLLTLYKPFGIFDFI
jgi:outer membrane protein assembly factor BamB